LIKNIPENLKFRGSKQHASALDLAGRFVETDLVIVSDPDCLMIKTEWISYLVNFIKEGGFDLVGTPEAYSPLNVYSRNGIMAYKFISPIPFLLFGKTQVIFLQSFMPDETTNFKLDTGYKLANDCLDGNVKFKLLQAFSTRSNTSEIFFLRNFSCTFYRFGSRNSGIWCVHFGRGSNRFGKNRSEFNLFTRIIKAYFDPLSFRHKISKFIKLTA
jgi:hypothetical protein